MFAVRLAMFLPFCALAAGCASFPDLDAAISEEAKQAPAPVLVDDRPIIRAAGPGRRDISTPEELQARASALQSRGAGQPAPVIDAAERARLLEVHERLREEASRVAPGS